MKGIKLNAQVMIKNLRVQNMHEKSLPPTGLVRSTELTEAHGLQTLT